jgi:hypothetical protein
MYLTAMLRITRHAKVKSNPSVHIVARVCREYTTTLGLIVRSRQKLAKFSTKDLKYILSLDLNLRSLYNSKSKYVAI